MKPAAFLAAALLALSLRAAAGSAEPREWTSTEGQALTATFVEAVKGADGEITAAKVRLASGQQLVLPLDRLSEADREHVAEAAKAKEEETKKAALAGRRAKWTENWDEAQKESAETGLPILLFMTGSDWCPPCMSLKSNVFEKRAFLDFASENLVLMMADFPRGKKQSRSVVQQNAKLKEQFPITGYPTVFLVKDGSVAGRWGGFSGGSEADYIDRIRESLR